MKTFFIISSLLLLGLGFNLCLLVMGQDPIYIGYLDHAAFALGVLGMMGGMGLLIHTLDPNQPENLAQAHECDCTACGFEL